MAGKTHAALMLEALSDGRRWSTHELVTYGAGYAAHSRAADLRKLGYSVKSSRSRTPDGSDVYFYELQGVPAEPSRLEPTVDPPAAARLQALRAALNTPHRGAMLLDGEAEPRTAHRGRREEAHDQHGVAEAGAQRDDAGDRPPTPAPSSRSLSSPGTAAAPSPSRPAAVPPRLVDDDGQLELFGSARSRAYGERDAA